jgi:hypothetical protein
LHPATKTTAAKRDSQNVRLIVFLLGEIVGHLPLGIQILTAQARKSRGAGCLVHFFSLTRREIPTVMAINDDAPGQS